MTDEGYIPSTRSRWFQNGNAINHARNLNSLQVIRGQATGRFWCATASEVFWGCEANAVGSV